MKKICALLRNKGLREDMTAILPHEKLTTYEAHEATHQQETYEPRAYMTLELGQMLNNIDPSGIRGIANMVGEGLSQDKSIPQFNSDEYQNWTQENKAQRINKEISSLEAILSPTQITRYREHMENELAW